MALEHRLDLRLSQKLILTPQLQMALKLLQMPQLELAQALTQELTENPFLEELQEDALTVSQPDTEAYSEVDLDDRKSPFELFKKIDIEEYFDERGSDGRDLGYFSPDVQEEPSFELFHSKKETLTDYLVWQLRLSKAPDEVRKTAEYVIANIDESGFLTVSEQDIMEFGATLENTREAIKLVQSFDPPGVGARDIKESLLIQLEGQGKKDSTAYKIINQCLDDFSKKRYPNIAKALNVPLQDVLDAVKDIERLNPFPGTGWSSSEPHYIVPDVYIYKEDGEYKITLNNEGMPRLVLNNSYKQLLAKKDTLTKEEMEFLKVKLKTAMELLKSLDQRNKTIYKVAESLLKFQRDFFDYGVTHLKPLNLKDIAQDIQMHESTISRVTSNKYLSCEHGIFSFKHFFSSSLQSEDGEISSTIVKDMIREIISQEDPKSPLSDEAIANKLKERNITIARRTVTKYREELKLPSQSQRRRKI